MLYDAYILNNVGICLIYIQLPLVVNNRNESNAIIIMRNNENVNDIR